MENLRRNNPALSRFEFDVDGELPSPVSTFARHHHYRPHRDTAWSSWPTEEIRAQGLKVAAQCGFVRAFVASHPEFNDLLR
jgi:hypothetical protein